MSDWRSDVCSSDLAQRDRVRIAVVDVIAEVGADRMPLDVGAVAKGPVRFEETVRRIAEQVLRAARCDAEAGEIAVLVCEIERSEERRVGHECVSTCVSGWWQYN